jgi:hypothetical protein
MVEVQNLVILSAAKNPRTSSSSLLVLTPNRYEIRSAFLPSAENPSHTSPGQKPRPLLLVAYRSISRATAQHKKKAQA